MLTVDWIEGADRRWDETLATMDGGDVFFSAAYHRACEADDRGRAALVVVSDGEHRLVHPLLMRSVSAVAGEPVEGGLSDAESAYGYTGPLASPDAPPAFLAAAWEAYAHALRQRRAVAEFVRLHPYLANERLLADDYSVFRVRSSVTLPLTGRGEADVWDAYPSVQRNMVRRAQAAGVTCRWSPLAGVALDSFLLLYEAAMHRLGAGEEYLFSRGYFETLADGLGERAQLLLAEVGGAVATAAVFLQGPRVMHYHLAAADPAARAPGQGNLLLHTAACRALDLSLDALHLGGGTADDPADPLLRFKLSVSRDTLPVHAAARVHDADAYESLCARWLARSERVERPRFHLLYRLPVSR